MGKKYEAFKIKAEKRVKSFGQRVTKLPSQVQSEITKEFEDFEERINQAFMDCRQESFRRLMDRVEGVLVEAEKRWKPSWMYPVTGGIFEGQVWFVSEEDKAAGLMQLGISRGLIWTEDELNMVVKAKAERDFLKAIHQVKMAFDGILVAMQGSESSGVESLTNEQEEVEREANIEVTQKK